MKQKIILWIVLLALILTLYSTQIYSSDCQFDREREELLMMDIDWSSESNLIAVGGSMGLWIYTPTLAEEILYDCQSPISSVAFNPSGDLLVAGSDNSAELYVWEIPSMQSEVIELSGDTVTSVDFSNDGSLLAVATSRADSDFGHLSDGTIHLLEVSTRSETDTVQSIAPIIRNIHLDMNSAIVIESVYPGYESHDVEIWDIISGEQVSEFRPNQVITSMAAHNGFVAVSTLDDNYDSFVRLWSNTTDEEILRIHHGANTVVALDISDNGLMLASGDISGIVIVSDVKSGDRLAVFDENESSIVGLSFSPDNTLLAILDVDGVITIWDFSSDEEFASLQIDVENDN